VRRGLAILRWADYAESPPQRRDEVLIYSILVRQAHPLESAPPCHTAIPRLPSDPKGQPMTRLADVTRCGWPQAYWSASVDS